MNYRERIAVAPTALPRMHRALVDAVRAGGGEVVDVAQASGLIWADPEGEVALPAAIAEGPDLQWVQLPFAGIENFADQLDPSLTWTCGKGVYADPVAEHVIALTLAGFRHLHDFVPARSWPERQGRNLLGAKVAIIGAGGITESLIRLLQPWRTRLRVVRRLAAPMHDVERTVAQSDEEGVAEVVGDADVVVLAAALTPETTGMVDAEFLKAMADDAWLINVARGGLVNHDALLDALLAGQIAGAALDVTTPEPLPEGHPLWDVPNCIITPHVGNTAEMGLPLLAERVQLNVARWIAGDPLLGPVDTGAGY